MKTLLTSEALELVVTQTENGIEFGRLIEIFADGEVNARTEQVMDNKTARAVAMAILNATWTADDELDERAWGMEVAANDGLEADVVF